MELQAGFMYRCPPAAGLQQVSRILSQHRVIGLRGDIGQRLQHEGPLCQAGVRDFQGIQADYLPAVVEDVDIEGARLIPGFREAFPAQLLFDVQEGFQQVCGGKPRFKGQAEVQEFPSLKPPGRGGVHGAHSRNGAGPLPDPEQGLLQGKRPVSQVASQGKVDGF